MHESVKRGRTELRKEEQMRREETRGRRSKTKEKESKNRKGNNIRMRIKLRGEKKYYKEEE